MKHIKLIVLILLFEYTYSQYIPKGSNIIKHHSYCLSYNTEHKQANWVYYTLTQQDKLKKSKRKNKFRPDPDIKTPQASLNDYKKTGYDRGHLCPSADRSSSQNDNDETFYLSNMSPQKPMFNRGIWKKIETEVRNHTYESDTLFIVTGPVLSSSLKTIGKSRISIPELFYKIVFVKNKNKAIAYLIKNEKSKKETTSFITTIDKIEELTGIDFFYQLEDNYENKIESKKHFWSDKKI